VGGDLVNVGLDRHHDERAEFVSSAGRARRRLIRWWKIEVANMQHYFARAVAWTATRAWQVTADWRAVRPIVSRASAHLAILILAVAAILLSGLNLPARESRANGIPEQTEIAPKTIEQNSLIKAVSFAPKTSPPAGNGNGVGSEHNGSANSQSVSGATIVRRAQPHTEIPNRPRLEVITYTVQPGDTVQNIAKIFDLQPTTLLWSNPKLEELPDLLRIGQEVVILPVDGVYHTVAEDDTLESIAEKYKVEVDEITGLSFNLLRAPLYRIQEGMKLIVPGGTKPYVPRRVTSYSGPIPTGARGTGAFVWPVLGNITQWYWWGHRAIDIGAPTGSAVLATDGGYVSFSGWTDIGYGYLIIVDHANGYSTYYGHLSQLYVMVGQQVERRQVIGAVGSTGNSSGPHLHLEIRYNGVEQNPSVYLP
jgi:murein DD-endopeptidase MepM/ murein hydrolase activator NlpD